MRLNCVLLSMMMFIVLSISGCSEKGIPGTADINIPNDNAEEKTTINKERDDEKVAFCNSKAQLTEILGVDFSDMEITDIQYIEREDKGTRVYIFIKGSNDILQSDGFMEESVEDIYRFNMKYWEEVGVETDSIRAYGLTWKEYEDEKRWTLPVERYWFILDDSYANKGNILLFAPVPFKLELDVEKILEQ